MTCLAKPKKAERYNAGYEHIREAKPVFKEMNFVVAKTQKTRNKFHAAARGRLLVIKRAVSSGAASSSEQRDQTQTLKALLYTP